MPTPSDVLRRDTCHSSADPTSRCVTRLTDTRLCDRREGSRTAPLRPTSGSGHRCPDASGGSRSASAYAGGLPMLPGVLGRDVVPARGVAECPDEGATMDAARTGNLLLDNLWDEDRAAMLASSRRRPIEPGKVRRKAG